MAKRKKTKEPKRNDPLDKLLKTLKIKEWDLLLVGDGSGSQWDKECGWGVTAIERSTMTRRVFYGAMNNGTMNFAEAMAYLQPLTYYLAKEEDKRRAGKVDVVGMSVHIVTDSEYCRHRGTSRSTQLKKNRGLWAMFELIQRQGLILNWHWVKRDIIALNRFSDGLSRAARVLFKESDLDEYKINGQDAYECNAWE